MAHTAHQLDPMLTVNEAAAYMRVSRRTVERLIARGELRPLHVGDRYRFHREAIDAYVSRNTRDDGAEE